MIITKICTISTSKRSICLNICVVFLSWAPVVSSLSLTLLHGGSTCTQDDGLMHGCTASPFLAQTDSDTASDTGACDRKHAVGQPRIRSSGKSVHSVSQSIRPTNSSVGVSYENTDSQILYTRGWVQKQTTNGMARGSAHVMFLLLRQECMSSVWRLLISYETETQMK